MQIPTQITFRHTEDPTGAIKTKIHERVEKLNQYHSNILSCQVVVEEPHQHNHKGCLYHVRVNLLVPKHTFVISTQSHNSHEHEDVYVAIRDAFDALVAQLEEFTRIQRGEVKHHGSQEE